MPGKSETPRTVITVGIIDDYVILLDSLSTWIEKHAPDLEVVSSATSWREFVQTDRFPPAVTLVGELKRHSLSMQDKVRACVAAGSKVVVIAGEAGVVHRGLLQAGASAVMSRRNRMIDIANAIRAAAGESKQPVPESSDGEQIAAPQRPRLSASETEAFSLYVKGYSTREVADSMGVGFETAKTFLRRVREKYAKVQRPAGRRDELIVRAHEDGLM
ncbi:DNA-binding response regulator [Humidisolicoccus flavus]|uniref:DNA-binding response regulator n=1 Tax=Humidisolicoccus flavus TaxID=3111414 RepID=UPI00324F148F